MTRTSGKLDGAIYRYSALIMKNFIQQTPSNPAQADEVKALAGLAMAAGALAFTISETDARVLAKELVHRWVDVGFREAAEADASCGPADASSDADARKIRKSETAEVLAFVSPSGRRKS